MPEPTILSHFVESSTAVEFVTSVLALYNLPLYNTGAPSA
jgi:hypothetical protein